VIRGELIGVAKCDVYGLRCTGCHADFHIDRGPNFCPMCGAPLAGFKKFGER
jgi:rRNA maturation endonuclease Nob1